MRKPALLDRYSTDSWFTKMSLPVSSLFWSSWFLENKTQEIAPKYVIISKAVFYAALEGRGRKKKERKKYQEKKIKKENENNKIQISLK